MNCISNDFKKFHFYQIKMALKNNSRKRKHDKISWVWKFFSMIKLLKKQNVQDVVSAGKTTIKQFI